jgi:alpha-beta hydrolase superfamily lysophospholipase
MEDLKEIIRFLSEKYRMDRYVLFGHSMGALIASAFMQNFVEESHYPERLVLNAPPVGVDGILGKILKILPNSLFKGACEIPYSLPIGGLVDLTFLSHDPRIKDDYLKDELNSVKLQSKLLFELIKTSHSTFSRPIRSKCPSFATVGSADRVVGAQDVIDYFTTVDKSFNFKIIDGAYHEIHFEIEKYRKPYFEHLKVVFGETLFKPEI